MGLDGWMKLSSYGIFTMLFLKDWAVLSDEQMSKRWPFSLLNNEQMSNWLGVEHQPEQDKGWTRLESGGHKMT